MHCDVCLDRLPKFPALTMLLTNPCKTGPWSLALLHACQTYLNRAC